MFSSSLVAMMVMLLLCFFGMLIMFLFIIYSQNQLTRALKETSNQHILAIEDIERQVTDIQFLLRGEHDKNDNDHDNGQKVEEPKVQNEKTSLSSFLRELQDKKQTSILDKDFFSEIDTPTESPLPNLELGKVFDPRKDSLSIKIKER